MPKVCKKISIFDFQKNLDIFDLEYGIRPSLINLYSVTIIG